MSISTIINQLLLLIIGCFLVQKSQLSVGQLVSAEIILSGILVSFKKIPSTVESLYEFETSYLKIDKVLGDNL